MDGQHLCLSGAAPARQSEIRSTAAVAGFHRKSTTSKKRHIKIQRDPDGEEMAIHVAADPRTLSELQTIILIEAHKKGIPYVPKTAED